jgi:hypothetical protein
MAQRYSIKKVFRQSALCSLYLVSREEDGESKLFVMKELNIANDDDRQRAFNEVFTIPFSPFLLFTFWFILLFFYLAVHVPL